MTTSASFACTFRFCAALFWLVTAESLLLAEDLVPKSATVAAKERPAMPDFRLPTLLGGELGPQDLRGRVVLWEFWATWCTPCHVQVEILKELYPAARARGIEFVAVATGEAEELVREHLAKQPYPYPVLLDPEERVATALEVLGLPTLVLSDRHGSIVWRNTGLVAAPTLEEAFAAAAAVPVVAGDP